ncbi:recombinase family protein [Corynebacterium sp. L4756]|uniref:recombinase family protein n=1 Tax=unclassified Corynebacterium TaxID=2624378 RepID=UPI00374DF503
MKKAYTYCRISADVEGDAHGVASQLRQCHDYAEQQGWEIGGDYIDNDLSAFSGVNRPEFERLLADMAAGKVPILVAWHIDRMARRVADLARIVEAAKQGGTEIRTVKAGEIDLSNASGEFVAYLMGAMAQFESRHSSERQVASQHDRALRGLWRGGPPPFGYKSAGTGQLVIDEEDAAWLKKWATWLRANDSLLAIRRRTHASVPEGHKLKRLSLYGLRSRLINPAIAGLVKEHGEITGEASWEPIFSREEYDTLVAILRDPSRRTAQSQERKWQGSGTYICGRCGTRLRCHRHPQYKDRRVYECPKHHMSIDRIKMDALVDEVIVAYLSMPQQGVFGADDSQGEALAKLHEERVTLLQRKDGLALSFTEGEIDRAQLTAGTKSLNAKLESVDKRVASLKRDTVVVDLTASPEMVEERWQAMAPDKRALVIRALFDVVLLPAGRLRLPTRERVEFRWK